MRAITISGEPDLRRQLKAMDWPRGVVISVSYPSCRLTWSLISLGGGYWIRSEEFV